MSEYLVFISADQRREPYCVELRIKARSEDQAYHLGFEYARRKRCFNILVEVDQVQTKKGQTNV